MIYRAAAAAWKRSWRSSLQRLALLAIAAPLMAAAFLSGDYVHLAIMYPVYAPQISAIGQVDEVAFNWVSSGFAGMGSERSLVYDRRETLGAEVGRRHCLLNRPFRSAPAICLAPSTSVRCAGDTLVSVLIRSREPDNQSTFVS